MRSLSILRRGIMMLWQKMKSYEEEYDLVVCSGGDGTLDEVVTGMLFREKQVPIGYIPTGDDK